MVRTEHMQCTIINKTVDVWVEQVRKTKVVRGCSNCFICPKTTFCRFVNPLTVQNPLIATREFAS